MKLQKLYSYTRQAINDFNMIQDGDKIAIGVSGGKDSLTLLYALSGLQKFISEKIKLVAITVDLGFGNFEIESVNELCNNLGIEYHVVKTQIADILKAKIKEGSFCSLCAKMRKGALNNFATELGCNKIAYAHHKDDFIETMLLSLLYEGQFFSFPPVKYFEEADITVIRPLIYILEKDIIGFQNKMNLQSVKNPCAFDKNTKRESVKKLLNQIQKENHQAKEKMFNAIMKGEIYKW
ncbi:MAG: tRNA 2-thiocytidine(32) synthetase TtcA [Spirochaetaceae bacterium]|nr:tRNA 2-thiocytidine(32) synthetase TtcA [Spirochaetaceae bacterium]